MADSKISGLPASTTPLAGTEELPIVQSGVTKKVVSNDLTVKNVRSNATTGILQIAGPAAAATRVMTIPDANFTAARTDAAQSFTGTQTFNSVVKNASNGANANFYKISKSFSGAGTSVTVLQITVPAATVFILVKASYINSRATFTNVGTSFAGEYYYAISRNGSGSDVVLDNNFGTKNWIGTSTTAGGTLNAISGTTGIARNGAEANTDPQVVNINFLAQCTGGSTGFVLMSFEVSSLSSTEITIQ